VKKASPRKVSPAKVAARKARRRAQTGLIEPSTIPSDPNAVLGVPEASVLIGMSEKYVYETFSRMVPPRKTGINGGGKALWQRKRIDDWLEVCPWPCESPHT
jgi:predicted DNA-binding transcriptional regulator AlpA